MTVIDANNFDINIYEISEFRGLDPVKLKATLEKFLTNSRKNLFYFRKKIETKNTKDALILINDLLSTYSYFKSTGITLALCEIRKCVMSSNFMKAVSYLGSIDYLVKLIDEEVLKLINLEHKKSEKSILIMEDDKMLGTIINKTLCKNNYSVDLAQNGLDGLELLTQKKYSLVITDIKMPFVSGVEVVTYIKKRLNYDTSVIATSSYVGDGEVGKSISLGADYFIKKPINFDELLLNVDKLII